MVSVVFVCISFASENYLEVPVSKSLSISFSSSYIFLDLNMLGSLPQAAFQSLVPDIMQQSFSQQSISNFCLLTSQLRFLGKPITGLHINRQMW